jgi:HAD superfamily hydrolase (TIGR01549 family)
MPPAPAPLSGKKVTLTLLLDLDDTLLDSNMGAFIPAYFQKLAGFLQDHVPPETLLKYLMLGTRAMLANGRPDRTLRQTFDEKFFPNLGVDPHDLEPHIQQFYDEVFPSLQGLTHPRPAAVELVEWAFSQGYRVAVSTNPLFPLKAILHRLRWAGLPPETYPFELISSYETFHFTKPSPAYFAEFLARLGWPEGPVLMVGDDLEMDIQAAGQLGLPTFWVSSPQQDLPADLPPPPRGSLEAVKPWLESADFESLHLKPESPEALSAVLLSTPAALENLTADISARDWKAKPAPGQWSLTEVLCHLRDVEGEVNLPRLQTLLQDDNPFITAQDTDAWATERGYAGQDGPSALQYFIETRLKTLDLLKSLNPQDWERPARHTIFGPTNLQELVGFIAEHDRGHVRQAWESLQQRAARRG